jgi:MFS family permease
MIQKNRQTCLVGEFMTSSSVATLNAPATAEGRRLSPAAAFLLLASLTVSFLAGSSEPTPLYGVYMAEWGLTPLMITVVFGIYALAVLVALLVAGRLSDHLGRRPVLLTATLAQAATMVLFVTATGPTGLLVARVLQGLTTGAAVGAIGAAMIDLDKARGTVANAVAPPFGSATGGIVAGVLVQFAPFPTHLVYIVFGLVFVVQALRLVFMSDSTTPRGGVLASLKPQLRLPARLASRSCSRRRCWWPSGPWPASTEHSVRCWSNTCSG